MSESGNVILTKGLPDDDYHGQTGEPVPLFSYSTAKLIIQKSPYHAWLDHPLLGGRERKATKAMDKGSIIHGMLLGSGPEIAVLPYDNFRTKAAQTERDDAAEAGLIPMLQKDMDEIHTAVHTAENQIRELAPYFFGPHESELAVRWEYNGVKTQSRLDWVSPEEGRIIDLKTTADASPQGFERSIVNFGYDIQQAMYRRAAEQAWPEMAGRFTWEYVCIETSDPYMVSVIETDASMFEMGDHKAERAARVWGECLESDNWPGYGRGFVFAPGWAVSREMEI